MSDFFGKLKSGAGKVAFEAEKMARQNKAQGELGQMKRQVEALFQKLGEMVYHQYVNKESTSPVFDEICGQIAELERLMALKAEEIKHIAADVYAAPGTVAPVPPVVVETPPPPVAPIAAAPVEEVISAADAPQTKICPNCSREMAIAVKFCPDCGTKM
jgi:hypothetical protein